MGVRTGWGKRNRGRGLYEQIQETGSKAGRTDDSDVQDSIFLQVTDGIGSLLLIMCGDFIRISEQSGQGTESTQYMFSACGTPPGRRSPARALCPSVPPPREESESRPPFLPRRMSGRISPRLRVQLKTPRNILPSISAQSWPASFLMSR